MRIRIFNLASGVQFGSKWSVSDLSERAIVPLCLNIQKILKETLLIFFKL